MAVLRAPAPATPPPPVAPRWRWDVDTFVRLGEMGVFGDTRVELVRGEVVAMPPPSPRHSGAVNPVAEILARAFAGHAVVRTEQPMPVAPETLVLPDIAVCRGTFATFRRRYPEPSEVLLVVEIALTSLEYDRTEKRALYASAGIPVYWLLDLAGGRLIAHTDPQEGADYAAVAELAPTDTVAPPAPGAEPLSVAALLGDPA